MTSSGGRLGERIANKAHREGRAAFKAGKTRRDNPYNGRAVRDSDEWLRYRNWENGWTFAWSVGGPGRRRERA
jgi:triphosphoribosyl-dephospho-CoA synthetase